MCLVTTVYLMPFSKTYSTLMTLLTAKLKLELVLDLKFFPRFSNILKYHPNFPETFGFSVPKTRTGPGKLGQLVILHLFDKHIISP